MKNLYIQLIDDKGKSTFHNIPLQSTVTIGKTEGCDIKISGKEVSPLHAIIETYDERSVFIRSLNPKKKVLVNGKEIDKTKLDFSDIIKIGNCEFQIKKVDLHDQYSDVKQPPEEKKKPEDESRLERTLKALTPPEKDKDKKPPLLDKPLSDDEIESSITIPESDAADEPPMELPVKEEAPVIATEPEEKTGEHREFTVEREIIKSSKSLRLKRFWHEIIVSDDLFALSNPITIGSHRKNTFVIPQNGLPNKFSLFVFEQLQPYLIFNSHIKGFINTKKHKKVSLDQAKEKLELSIHKGTQNKLKLGFEDSGELEIGTIKFLFEFVQTPAPAARDKFFAKMDKLYKRSLIAGFILLLLFALLSIVTPSIVSTASKEKKEIRVIPGPFLKPIARVIQTPPPRVINMGGSQGKEGEGRRLAGKEGRRGKSRQGRKGEVRTSQLDLIREEGLGALMLFRKSGAFKEISKSGGGGDLANSTTTLKAGLPGETRIRSGKGIKDLGGTGGGGTFVGRGEGGLGTKGDGLGAKGTGKAPYGTKGEARVTTADIVEDEIGIMGEMDPSIIERLIRNHLGYIKWCYEKQLNVSPDIEGKIVVDFIIGVEGRVTASRVKTSTMGNETVESCIARRIRTIKFPSPGAGIVQVFYPFIFRVAGGF